MSDAAQDIKTKVSAQMSSLDSRARSSVAELRSSSASRLSPLVNKAKYHASNLWERYLDFSHDSPAVSAFLTIQLLLAALPLAVFLTCLVSTILTVGFFATLIVGSVLFTTGAVLAMVLTVTGTIGFGIFVWLTSCYLGVRWLSMMRRLGIQEGTREFLFGVETKVKRETEELKAYGLRAEDRLAAQFEGTTQLEDVAPGIVRAA